MNQIFEDSQNFPVTFFAGNIKGQLWEDIDHQVLEKIQNRPSPDDLENTKSISTKKLRLRILNHNAPDFKSKNKKKNQVSMIKQEQILNRKIIAPEERKKQKAKTLQKVDKIKIQKPIHTYSSQENQNIKVPHEYQKGLIFEDYHVKDKKSFTFDELPLKIKGDPIYRMKLPSTNIQIKHHSKSQKKKIKEETKSIQSLLNGIKQNISRLKTSSFVIKKKQPQKQNKQNGKSSSQKKQNSVKYPRKNILSELNIIRGKSYTLKNLK